MTINIKALEKWLERHDEAIERINELRCYNDYDEAESVLIDLLKEGFSYKDSKALLKFYREYVYDAIVSDVDQIEYAEEAYEDAGVRRLADYVAAYAREMCVSELDDDDAYYVAQDIARKNFE